ncbi:hypothetical protein AMK09_06785 [Streptomyces sp. CB02488]|uniref:DUF5703 domain-containing protein n=1 Tax=Streptomyces sp. CB02488 TaxID=1703920 RepID=UPI00093AEA04|nr:DUF5703 domain-containing protein [Streptomyces sp. CB02488]OKK24492.1 hypothetical protein AMK09_06785 [Streptomyces sp. CB02488]
MEPPKRTSHSPHVPRRAVLGRTAGALAAAMLPTGALSAIAAQPAAGATGTGAQAASAVGDSLPAYNEVWTSKSTDITGSMPIGNGVQAANVWVEGNQLRLLLTAGDAWEENVRLAKVGRLDITFSPNPFESGGFRQELKLHEGEIVITAGSSPAITTRIWAGANEQTIHVESDAPSAFTVDVALTNLRPKNNPTPATSSFTFMDLVNTEDGYVGIQPKIWADGVQDVPGAVRWAHHNGASAYDEIMRLQKLDPAVQDDPLTGRTFGGQVRGDGFDRVSATRLLSTGGTSHRLDITLHSSIDASAGWRQTWGKQIGDLAAASAAKPVEQLRTDHRGWWDQYWNRSYIFVTGDADATKVTKGWLHTRYVQAVAGRTPAMPIRFNGSLFTPGHPDDPDFRMWNSYHGFNQRFAYWNMLGSGDFDLMQPYFDQYANSLPLARARVKAFWGQPTVAEPSAVELPATQGAMWPEVMGLWGQAVGGEYGWNRTGHGDSWFSGSWTRWLYAGNVEIVTMMLDYYSHTGDTAFARDKLLPVAREVVKFYDTHWHHKDGKIEMYPMYSGEGDRNLHNPAADTAGLHRILGELQTLPTSLVTSADLAYWAEVEGRLPALAVGTNAQDNDTAWGTGDRLKTAHDVFLGTDTNNQNLYPVFPMRLFGAGLPHLDLAVASYQERRGKYPANGTQDWRHDAIHAAYLGLTAEAKFQTVGAFRAGSWRYSGFGPGSADGEPGQEAHAIAKTALQSMLLHPGADDDAILYNAWPSEWDVRFKLHTTGGRTVEGQLLAGKSEHTVTPAGAGDLIVDERDSGAAAR